MYRIAFTLLTCFFMAASVRAAIIESGHTSVWRDPARSGEGFTLEVLNDTTASLAWFTFDEDGDPRWAYAVGTILRGEDERIEFGDVFRSTGGVFGPAYDADAVTTERVGRATLRFEDCDRGTFSFDAFGQAMDIEVQRLTKTMAAGCAPIHGLPGDVIQPYAGQSGIWRDVSRFGQGLQLQWIASNAAVLGWYTFDAEGNPYWMTGLGTPVGAAGDDGTSRIVFETLYAPRGARFGDAFDPDEVELVDWGRAELDLTCDSGVLRFDSKLEAFSSGERQIQLLTRSVPLSCPWSKPRLSQLYEIGYAELELPAAPQPLSDIQVRDMADEGTIVGIVPSTWTARVVRLRSGEDHWEMLDGGDTDYIAMIAPDASRIVSTLRGQDLFAAAVWRDATAWQTFGDAGFVRSIVFGASHDRTQIVGSGYLADSTAEYPWAWGGILGQKILPRGVENGAGIPTSVSNDGRIVVGAAVRVINNVPRRVAVRWVDGNEPETLRDALGYDLGGAPICNADCSLIFSGDQAEVVVGHPSRGQAWFWREPGKMAYLGRLDGANAASWWPYGVTDVSVDGSIVGGGYTTVENQAEGFVRTQATGLISVKEIMSEIGAESDWDSRVVQCLSSDGLSILLRGTTKPLVGPTQHRAAIMRLTPRASPDGH
jgi:hypothetical protein